MGGGGGVVATDAAMFYNDLDKIINYYNILNSVTISITFPCGRLVHVHLITSESHARLKLI